MITLARKYRPKTVADLLGQEALATALKTAIDGGRIAPAYILTGVRGIGKTTTARIIARAVNCEQGPTLKPCGTCQSCKEISTDSSLDVTELDAATNNGIQDMRELIENVAYAPMRKGAYKIYIIDEAHMLSTPAFNALLKTLEEPPEHVIFIFATTEPRKIPVTIQSRCQKFSLRRIKREVIAANLEAIAGKEGATLDEGVANLIAQAGEGSMRDALSILDQALSSAGAEPVKLDPVREMIGRATPTALIDTLSSIAAGKPADAIRRWREIINTGIDPIVALDDLMGVMHMVSLAAYDPELLADEGLSPEDGTRLKRASAKLFGPTLLQCIRLLSSSRKIADEAPNREKAAETLILRLAQGFVKKA